MDNPRTFRLVTLIPISLLEQIDACVRANPYPTTRSDVVRTLIERALTKQSTKSGVRAAS